MILEPTMIVTKTKISKILQHKLRLIQFAEFDSIVQKKSFTDFSTDSSSRLYTSDKAVFDDVTFTFENESTFVFGMKYSGRPRFRSGLDKSGTNFIGPEMTTDNWLHQSCFIFVWECNITNKIHQYCNNIIYDCILYFGSNVLL